MYVKNTNRHFLSFLTREATNGKISALVWIRKHLYMCVFYVIYRKIFHLLRIWSDCVQFQFRGMRTPVVSFSSLGIDMFYLTIGSYIFFPFILLFLSSNLTAFKTCLFLIQLTHRAFYSSLINGLSWKTPLLLIISSITHIVN